MSSGLGTYLVYAVWVDILWLVCDGSEVSLLPRDSVRSNHFGTCPVIVLSATMSLILLALYWELAVGQGTSICEYGLEDNGGQW
jgi:hypothetical protein